MVLFQFSMAGAFAASKLGGGASVAPQVIYLTLEDMIFDCDFPFRTPAGKRTLAARYYRFIEELSKALHCRYEEIGPVAIWDPNYQEWSGVREDLQNLRKDCQIHPSIVRQPIPLLSRLSTAPVAVQGGTLHVYPAKSGDSWARPGNVAIDTGSDRPKSVSAEETRVNPNGTALGDTIAAASAAVSIRAQVVELCSQNPGWAAPNSAPQHRAPENRASSRKKGQQKKW